MEIDGSASAVALLGLDGFVVRTAEVIDGELHQMIETTASRVGCATCGVIASLHDRREVRVRDLPSGERPVVLVWSKRVWRCEELDCDARTWSEQHPEIRARASLSERARSPARLAPGPRPARAAETTPKRMTCKMHPWSIESHSPAKAVGAFWARATLASQVR